MVSKDKPTHEQIRLIFKDTYNLYLKYKDAKTDNEYSSFVGEIGELFITYPYPLCKAILTELVNIIGDAANEVSL